MFVNNTVGNGAAPDLSGKDALGTEQPGLDDMTLKSLEVLTKRGGDDGFFLMVEAASVDKQVNLCVHMPSSFIVFIILSFTT